MIRKCKIDPSENQNQAFFAALDNRHQKICSMLLSDKRVTAVNLTFIIEEVIRVEWAEILEKLIKRFGSEFSMKEENVRNAYALAEKSPRNNNCKNIMKMLEGQMKELREEDEEQRMMQQEENERRAAINRSRIFVVSFYLTKPQVVWREFSSNV